MKVNFIKVSFHDSDFSTEIRLALDVICSNFNISNNVDEGTIERIKESICTIAAAYIVSFKIIRNIDLEIITVERYKTYLSSKLLIELSTKKLQPTSLDVQWVYDVNTSCIYSQFG